MSTLTPSRGWPTGSRKWRPWRYPFRGKPDVVIRRDCWNATAEVVAHRYGRGENNESP